jgi:hypothetical protein
MRLGDLAGALEDQRLCGMKTGEVCNTVSQLFARRR